MANLTLTSRIHGCWLGKSIGGTLGLPAEGKPGPLAFSYYDPVPTSAPPNDDLELQLVWLHLLEQRGFALTQRDLADAWLAHIHYMWDEYGRCRWNLRRGVPPSAAGTFENHFVSGMGSPIRSEIWACLCAGNPAAAARYAALDASLDHDEEGIAGEVYLAVLQSLVLGGAPLDRALDEALGWIAPTTETARALRLAFNLHRAGRAEWDAYQEIVRLHGHENFTHAPLNLALIGWAFVYGAGDFDRSILLATNCGYDTDCTAATVGATLGMILGAEGIAERWKTPIGDGVFLGAGIQGIDAAKTLGELTARTERLARAFAALSPQPAPVIDATPSVNLSDLPGTILLRPLDGSPTVPWANGELPDAVKAAGGAEWDWVCDGRSRALICLARDGARLLVDGVVAVDCPAGVDYVPATHRCAPEARVDFIPKPGVRRLRVELAKASATQEASVILAYPNLHLAPWTEAELPHAARL